MLNALKIMLASVLLVLGVGVAAVEANAYLKAEATKYEAAAKIIQQDALKKMLEANATGNLQKLAYYRWRYNNVATIIADAEGPSSIIAGQKKKNR